MNVTTDKSQYEGDEAFPPSLIWSQGGSAPPATVRALDAVLETFRSWLYLPDPGPVYVACAGVAVNRIDRFDPTWIVLIGAAGSGKTEALNATTGLEGIYLAGTLTEASLLSGTPRKDTAAGASGGLLREIGSSGILVLKDFGSILSMHREQRANVLAALREIYDGSWHRDVGMTAVAVSTGKAALASSPAPRQCSTNTTASWPSSESASCSTGSRSSTRARRGRRASLTMVANAPCGGNSPTPSPASSLVST